jgi:hypothetical protein
VLRGFPWERQLPEVVTCEFEDLKTKPLGYLYQDIGDLLLAKGYQVYLSEWAPIVRYGVSHKWLRWTKYPCAQLGSAAWGNFVAFKQGSHLASVERYISRYQRS